MAVETVPCEPLSGRQSLLTGKIAGNSTEMIAKPNVEQQPSSRFLHEFGDNSSKREQGIYFAEQGFELRELGFEFVEQGLAQGRGFGCEQDSYRRNRSQISQSVGIRPTGMGTLLDSGNYAAKSLMVPQRTFRFLYCTPFSG